MCSFIKQFFFIICIDISHKSTSTKKSYPPPIANEMPTFAINSYPIVKECRNNGSICMITQIALLYRGNNIIKGVVVTFASVFLFKIRDNLGFEIDFFHFFSPCVFV